MLFVLFLGCLVVNVGGLDLIGTNEGIRNKKTVIRQNGYCSTYGMFPGKKVTKPYNGPAKDVDAETFVILKEVCPQLTTGGIHTTKVCCDKEQIKALKENLGSSSALFSRCPAANRNFKHMWCQYTCSQNQSTFLEFNSGTVPELTNAKYYITRRFSDSLYDSIKSVVSPGTNGKVLDLICGKAASKCNPESFLASIGAPGKAPYRITFVIGKNESGFVNDDVIMVGCNET